MTQDEQLAQVMSIKVNYVYFRKAIKMTKGIQKKQVCMQSSFMSVPLPPLKKKSILVWVFVSLVTSLTSFAYF